MLGVRREFNMTPRRRTRRNNRVVGLEYLLLLYPAFHRRLHHFLYSSCQLKLLVLGYFLYLFVSLPFQIQEGFLQVM